MKIKLKLRELPIIVSSFAPGELKKLPEGRTGIDIPISPVEEHLSKGCTLTHCGRAMADSISDLWYCQTEDEVFINGSNGP